MIKIRKHQREDIPYRLKWLNNPKVNEFLGDDHANGTTLAKQKKWFDIYEKSKNKKFFTICDNKKPIGMFGLYNIDKTLNSSDLFIAIGDYEYRGKGIGKIAMKWLIDYGFKKLKLHKIKLGVAEDNLSAVNLYKSVGFEIEGILKDEYLIKGVYHNDIAMAIFNNDQN